MILEFRLLWSELLDPIKSSIRDIWTSGHYCLLHPRAHLAMLNTPNDTSGAGSETLGILSFEVLFSPEDLVGYLL